LSSRRFIKDITADFCFARGPNAFRVSSRTRSCAELCDDDGLRPDADPATRVPDFTSTPVV
jgi:hypothetical protein